MPLPLSCCMNLVNLIIAQPSGDGAVASLDLSLISRHVTTVFSVKPKALGSEESRHSREVGEGQGRLSCRIGDRGWTGRENGPGSTNTCRWPVGLFKASCGIHSAVEVNPAVLAGLQAGSRFACSSEGTRSWPSPQLKGKVLSEDTKAYICRTKVP